MLRRFLPFVSLLAAAFTAGAWVDKDDAWVAPRKNWWAFKKPVRAEVPAIADQWVKTPIDAFVLEGLRAKSLAPSPVVERARLIRRLTLDLTGLPPAPTDVEAFVNDRTPRALEKVIDRLMASSQYGERWAVKWLDVARYADTNGYEADSERPNAWRYRDYVVKAFNQDKPYDRFIREQIAGDELFPGDPDALIATGFHRAGPVHLVGGNTDKEETRQEVLTEMTGAVGSVYLGLTIGCARCHNHKFDPIPQSDFYRLQAVFAGTEGKDVPLGVESDKKTHDEALKAHKQRTKPIRDQIDEIEKPYRERLMEANRAKLDPKVREAMDVPKGKRTEEQQRLAKEGDAQIKVAWDVLLAVLNPEDKARRAGLRRKMHDIDYEQPAPLPAAFAVANAEKSPPTHILKVGNYKMKLDQVEPGLLRVLDPPPVTKEVAGRRSTLADWLASPEHPLTARVMVNRIWQLRMGTGLVLTPNDFGVLGQRPTNQKLLDWLANEFVASGWSVKKLDRMILSSSVYQQDTRHDEAKAAVDGDNKLYWRANRRRLEGEFLRDSVLAVSGSLNARQGGRPIKTPLEPEVYDLIFTEGEPDNLWPVNRDPAEHDRRSMYLLNKRTVRLPFLANFDQPDNMTSCPVRPQSTHALQALSLLNSEPMQRLSERFAARLEAECGSNVECRLRRAYMLALARGPRAEEVAMAREFLDKGGPWADLCLALFNRNEFAYVP